MTKDDEFSRCRECYSQLTGILDQNLRDFCQKCCDDLKLEPGLRTVPLIDTKCMDNENDN